MTFRVTIRKELIVDTSSDPEHNVLLKQKLEEAGVVGVPSHAEIVQAIKSDFAENGPDAFGGDLGLSDSDLDIAILEGAEELEIEPEEEEEEEVEDEGDEPSEDRVDQPAEREEPKA